MKVKLLAQEFFAVFFFFFFFCKNRGNAILLGYRPSWRKPLLPGWDCCRIFTAGKAIGKRRRVGSDDDEYHLVITEMAMRFTFRSTSNLAHNQQLTVSELAPVLKKMCVVLEEEEENFRSLSACHLLSLSLSEIKTKERERETVVKTFCSSRATDGSMPIFLLGISGVIKEIDLITFGHEKRSCLLSDEASPDQICGTHTLSLFLAIKIRKIPSRGLQSKKKK